MTTVAILILIAVGAVLAFGVSFELAGVGSLTAGATLIVVGSMALASTLTTHREAPASAVQSGLTPTPPPTNV